jgi:ribosomal protein S18 acetylase RimI-like enzyme
MSLQTSLNAAAQAAGFAWQLRVETEQDLAFAAEVYIDYRTPELAVVDWPAEQKRAFLSSQFQAQNQHYRQHYVGAEFLLVQWQGRDIGRLYLFQSASECRVMDICLLTPYRQQGIGSQLLHTLLAQIDAMSLKTSLHVEVNNPAQHLYQRLGFEALDTVGVYSFMQRLPS